MPLPTNLAGIVAESGPPLAMLKFAYDVTFGQSGSERAKHYLDNVNWPNVIPSPDALIAARNRGKIDGTMFYEMMVANGCLPDKIQKFTGSERIGQCWRATVEAGFDRPPSFWVLEQLHRGNLPASAEGGIFRAYSFDSSITKDWRDCWRPWPSLQEAVAGKQRFEIPNQQYFAYLKHAGEPKQQEKDFYEMLYRSRLTVGDYTSLFNRGVFEDGDWENEVRQVSGYLDGDIEHLRKLREGIPGPADLVRFAVREAFNDDQSEKLKLDDEFEETGAYQYWMAAQGLGFTQGHGPAGSQHIAYWPRYYWRAHWQLMSPTQCYEALHRLRPNRMHLYQGLVPNITPFEFDDLNALLKANDYPVPQRSWLAAISYGTPDLRAIRNMYAFDIIPDQEFIELMKDRGVIEQQARQMLEAEKIQKPYKQVKYRVPPLDSYDKGLYNAILDSWRIGAITIQNLEQGLLSILRNPQVVTRIIAAEVRKNNNKTVKTFTDYVRRSFFTGEVSATVAMATLTAGGITNTKATELVNLWSVQLDLPRKVTSAGKLVEWYRHGALTVQGLADRLQRLGYAPDTILLTIAEGQRLIAEDTARRAKAEEQARKAASKEAKARAKEQFVADNRFRTIAQLTRWYRKDIITSDQLWSLMGEMAVPYEDMDKHYEEIVGIPHVN